MSYAVASDILIEFFKEFDRRFNMSPKDADYGVANSYVVDGEGNRQYGVGHSMMHRHDDRSIEFTMSSIVVIPKDTVISRVVVNAYFKFNYTCAFACWWCWTTTGIGIDAYVDGVSVRAGHYMVYVKVRITRPSQYQQS